MVFKLGTVQLTHEPGKGYKHPATGDWVERADLALKGWIEEDAEIRAQWVALVAAINDFRLRNQASRALEESESAEIVF